MRTSSDAPTSFIRPDTQSTSSKIGTEIALGGQPQPGKRTPVLTTFFSDARPNKVCSIQGVATLGCDVVARLRQFDIYAGDTL